MICKEDYTFIGQPTGVNQPIKLFIDMVINRDLKINIQMHQHIVAGWHPNLKNKLNLIYIKLSRYLDTNRNHFNFIQPTSIYSYLKSL